MSHAAPDTEFIPFVSTAPALRWKANHSRGWHAVEGGWAAVRVLVGAIDGDWWPWTQIEGTDSFRWFQVLGTPDRCVLELGQDGHVTMVYRADHGGPGEWLDCQARAHGGYPQYAATRHSPLTRPRASANGGCSDRNRGVPGALARPTRASGCRERKVHRHALRQTYRVDPTEEEP